MSDSATNRNDEIRSGDAPLTIGRGSGGGTLRDFNAGLKQFFERKKMLSHKWSSGQMHREIETGRARKAADS